MGACADMVSQFIREDAGLERRRGAPAGHGPGRHGAGQLQVLAEHRPRHPKDAGGAAPRPPRPGAASAAGPGDSGHAVSLGGPPRRAARRSRVAFAFSRVSLGGEESRGSQDRNPVRPARACRGDQTPSRGDRATPGRRRWPTAASSSSPTRRAARSWSRATRSLTWSWQPGTRASGSATLSRARARERDRLIGQASAAIRRAWASVSSREHAADLLTELVDVSAAEQARQRLPLRGDPLAWPRLRRRASAPRGQPSRDLRVSLDRLAHPGSTTNSACPVSASTSRHQALGRAHRAACRHGPVEIGRYAVSDVRLRPDPPASGRRRPGMKYL